jgi:hypothetical protein
MADKPDNGPIWEDYDLPPGESLTYDGPTLEELQRYHNLAVRITWTPEERAEIDQHLREWLDGQFGNDG